MERQKNFFDALETPQEPQEDVTLREWASGYLDLEILRDPRTDIRNALRYEPEKLPEELHLMIQMMEVLLTPAPHEQVKSPHDLARILMTSQGFLLQEQLGCACLDTKNRLQKLHMVYQGSLNASLVRVGEVFREAIKLNSAAIIVYHNHPSSDPTPSPEDVLVTREIVQAGKLLDCDVLDHLVIGQGRWVSMRERNLGFDR